MKPLNDYIVIELLADEKTSNFKVQEEEPTFAVGKIINGPDDMETGAKVLFKKYAFDEYRGQFIGKIENVIAILE